MKRYIYHPQQRGRNSQWWYGQAPKILTDDEVVLLLDEALKYSLRDFTLIFFAVNTGLRNSEVRGLNVEDVWFGDAVPNWLELSPWITKNHKPRMVPINDENKQVLETYLNDERSTGRITGDNDPLFRSKVRNLRLGPRDFQQIVRRHSLKALNYPAHPHMLRHTFATKLSKRRSLKIVQNILGHDSLQSTQIYLHPSTTDMFDAVNELSFTSGQPT